MSTTKANLRAVPEPPAYLDELDAEAPEPTPPLGAESDAQGSKLADKVIGVVEGSAELFHDTKSVAYAVVQLEERRAVLRLASRPMRSWIARTARRKLGQSIGSGVLDEALLALDGIARFDCDERTVHLRVAEEKGAIYIDIGDQTGACIEVTREGWRVLDDVPVMFRRPDAMRPLPRPERGGTLDDLRPFFNAADDDALHLFAAWMVAALRPGRPFPILALHGEQGTAKSTASRVARALTDPNAAPIRSAPRSEDDLAVASVHSHVVAFDNLSGVQPSMSDALCRLATGGGLSKRTLFSDDDETVLDAIRPVIVNGIDDLANRPDLAERCLVLTLQPIPRSKRRDEAAFWTAFEPAAPRILGVLLDGVASALRRLPVVELAELPRMADFAKWIAAAEPGLGLSTGTLLGAYQRNRARVVDVALDASPVATAVRALLDQPTQHGHWKGTPDECHSAVDRLTSDATRRSPGWPKNARALSSALRRSATFLRSVGIALDLDGTEGRGDAKHRVYRLSKGAPGETAPTVPSGPGAEGAEQDGGRDEVLDPPHDRSHVAGATAGDIALSQANGQPPPPDGHESGPGGRGDGGDGSGGCFSDLLDEGGAS